MNKKFKKIIAIGLSVLTISSCAIPVMAATSYKNSTASVVEDINGADIQGNDTNQNKKTKYSEYSENKTVSTNVYVTQESTFSVVAPVVAILNGKAGEANTGDVRYKTFGNIASDEVITVEPDDTFYLSQAGKDDILCTVEAKNTITDFTYANGIRPDNAMTRDFTITANDMTAGSWHGSYNTNISLDKPTPQWYDITSQLNLANGENNHWNKFGILTEGNETTPYRTVNIPVSAGETYRVSGNVWGSDRLLIAKSELGGGGQYTVDNAMIPAEDVNGSGVITDQILTIPEGANWLCISTAKFALSQFKLEKLGNDIVDIIPYTNEDFYWNFDKPYVTITVDDTNDNIDEIAEVFARHNMPCNYATKYNLLENLVSDGRTKKEVLLEAQASGSEILAHHYFILDSTSSDDVYTEVYENTKTNLENAGFVVNGVITVGGANYNTQNFATSTVHAYNAGYLYADLTSCNDVYNHRYLNPRTWNETGDITYWQNQIDNLVAKGTGWLNIASHVDAEWESSHTMNPDMLDQILTYCEEKGVEVVTWKTLYDNCGMNK